MADDTDTTGTTEEPLPSDYDPGYSTPVPSQGTAVPEEGGTRAPTPAPTSSSPKPPRPTPKPPKGTPPPPVPPKPKPKPASVITPGRAVLGVILLGGIGLAGYELLGKPKGGKGSR